MEDNNNLVAERLRSLIQRKREEAGLHQMKRDHLLADVKELQGVLNATLAPQQIVAEAVPIEGKPKRKEWTPQQDVLLAERLADRGERSINQVIFDVATEMGRSPKSVASHAQRHHLHKRASQKTQTKGARRGRGYTPQEEGAIVDYVREHPGTSASDTARALVGPLGRGFDPLCQHIYNMIAAGKLNSHRTSDARNAPLALGVAA